MDQRLKTDFPFEDRTLSLRDGRRARMRRGGVKDAAAFREYLIRVAPTSDQIGLYQDEVGTVEENECSLARRDPSTGGLLLLAEPEDQAGLIVGDCSLSTFPRRKFAGLLVMGMLCDEAWRGVGLGRALLEASLDWARANPGIRRVELGVLATNPRAQSLYESFGFKVEARREARCLQEDGSLVDDIQMVLAV
ncbi:MAG: N-acetyltransferase family protein [Phycisphaerales bacterium]